MSKTSANPDDAPARVEGLITEHLNLWTSAIKNRSTAGRGSSKKIELYGIKKLRELILELAVRGLLAPQDPNDEPATELLKRITAEKARLENDERLRTSATDGVLSKEEYLSAPNEWEWLRLGNLARFIDYRGKTPEKIDSGVRLITAKNIKNGYIDINPEEFISEDDYESWMTRGFPRVGDTLFTTEAPLGNAANIDLKQKFALAQRSICFQWHAPEISGFMLLQILARPFQNQLIENATGITATGIKASKLKEIPVAIPPLAEQHRIVAKVDELMVLCDQLEQQTEASLAAHQTLVETLLNALTTADSGNTDKNVSQQRFQQAWQRIADHFDILLTTEQSIDQLKQTILQLAVIGKLVPQKPKDEPASELLKIIATEKARLVKEGKIKKEKPLPPITEEEEPFALPEGWEWERLPNLSFLQEGPGIMAKDFRSEGIPLIRIAGVHGSIVSLEGCNFLEEEMVAKKWHHFRLDEGDIILSSSASLGKVSKVGSEAIGSIAYTGLIRFKPYSPLFDEYLIRFFSSNEFSRQIDECKKGAAIMHFGPTHLRWMLVPLPPLAEQYRIVAKVDELMALCDQIKGRLNHAQITQLQLADAITERTLAS